MANLDFVEAFYNAPLDRSTFLVELDAVLADPHVNVGAMPFSTAYSPTDLFGRRLTTRRGRHRETILLRESDGLWLYRLNYDFESEVGPVDAEGRFFVRQHDSFPNVYVAYSIESRSYFKRGLLPLLRSLFPRIVLGFVPHRRLRRLLQTFKERHEYDDLRIVALGHRLWLPTKGPSRHAMSARAWPHESLETTLQWLHENNGWIESVEFEAIRNHHVEAVVSVTREGLVRTTRSLWRVVSAFIDPICRIHDRDFNLFSNRSRVELPPAQVRPLTITFAQGQFAEREENLRFISAMRSMRSASVSVLHGNPYVHLSTVDYLDGSTFDVWVLSQEHAVIVPQLYASVGAIKRLVNHIFETYAEGAVGEYREGK